MTIQINNKTSLKTQKRKVYYSRRSKRVRVGKSSFWCRWIVCWSLSLLERCHCSKLLVWRTATLVPMYVKLVAAYSSMKVSMWNVRSRGRERGLSWMLTRCSLVVGRQPKWARKNSSKEEEGINALWSVCGRIAWWGHWFARGNRSMTATI